MASHRTNRSVGQLFQFRNTSSCITPEIPFDIFFGISRKLDWADWCRYVQWTAWDDVPNFWISLEGLVPCHSWFQGTKNQFSLRWWAKTVIQNDQNAIKDTKSIQKSEPVSHTPNSPCLHGQIHLNREKYVFASPSAPKNGDAGCMIHCSYLEELWRILTFIISQPYHS